ncbi:acyl carrier protein [Francisella sp. Scap27]|uniref:acyl carrier protein n=1 Tax=Francisella sp. Scap27 TaxID=2589986 RepID=UPI0015BB2859|nr:acyl carrier protein [Francisella sp. Scap27]QLE78829.1 acyl carrier protein [Francisella sp. Scap27]
MVTREDIINVIKEADVMFDLENVVDDLSLEEQGLDSLDAVTVFLLVEEKYDIKIPDTDIEQVQTLTSLIHYVNTKL